MNAYRPYQRRSQLPGLPDTVAESTAAAYAAGASAYSAGSFGSAYDTWLPLARQGVPQAAYLVGLLLDRGLVECQDPAVAAGWYVGAADAGEPGALFNLALLYRAGRGVAQNSGRYLQLMQQLAEQGDGEAIYLVGRAHDTGETGRVDRALAAHWYLRAAKTGFAPAQNALGDLLRLGDGVPRDLPQAREWFQRAAVQGFGYAQVNLGYLYQKGVGGPRDLALAANWYREAALHGDPVAQYNLAQMYRLGQGVRLDLNQARRWYRQAAANGHPMAMRRLKSWPESVD